MKKILIAAVAAATLTVPCAYADSLPATVNESKILIEQNEGMPESLIAACYDENGVLTYAGRVSAEDGMYAVTLPRSFDEVKLYDIGVKTYTVELTAATPSPEATAVPEKPTATEAPEVTETPEPTLNPAYEKEVDAVNAFAVVDKVVTTLNDNNEEVYAISCFYQGMEITVEVAQDIIIKSAPTAFSELEGSDAMALEKGDVIFYETNLAGSRVRGINLIYRPTNILEGNINRYFTDEGKAGGMWSAVPYGGKSPSGRYAYAFGIVVEKYDNTLILYSNSGIEETSIDIDYKKDTVTYICDMEGKPELEIASPSGIKKSRISKSAIDDEDNITFSTDYTYSLALVRLVDDVAADIIVYQDVEF